MNCIFKRESPKERIFTYFLLCQWFSVCVSWKSVCVKPITQQINYCPSAKEFDKLLISPTTSSLWLLPPFNCLSLYHLSFQRPALSHAINIWWDPRQLDAVWTICEQKLPPILTGVDRLSLALSPAFRLSFNYSYFQVLLDHLTAVLLWERRAT